MSPVPAGPGCRIRGSRNTAIVLNTRSCCDMCSISPLVARFGRGSAAGHRLHLSLLLRLIAVRSRSDLGQHLVDPAGDLLLHYFVVIVIILRRRRFLDRRHPLTSGRSMAKAVPGSSIASCWCCVWIVGCPALHAQGSVAGCEADTQKEKTDDTALLARINSPPS